MSVKRVTGHETFAGDLRIPGLLHARVVRSPRAHARVLRIDSSAARALPGVVAVLTHEDVPAAPIVPGERPTLGAVVRFVGDRVAVVAAEDPELAQRATEGVRAEYEDLPAVLDPEEAMDAGAPSVHSGSPNLAARFDAVLGDPEAAFAGAESVLEGTYRVAASQAAPIETHAVITWLDEDGRIVVRTSTESPFRVQQTLAARLGVPAARIRVVQPQVGGGFGGKSSVGAEDLCALVTLRTGRAVRLTYSREEELTIAPAAPAQVVRVRSGLRGGRLQALELRVLAGMGAYPGATGSLLRGAAGEALMLYGVPHLRFEGLAAFTHLPETGALRGRGALPALFALESHLDEQATALGEDPVEFRRRHLAGPDDVLRISAALGLPPPVQHADVEGAIRAAGREIGWSGRRTGDAGSGPRRRGVGMALLRHHAESERGAASIRIHQDGSFNLFVGASAMGVGAEAAYAAVAADVLGVSADQVVPAAGDSDSSPRDPGAPAPTLYLTGRAVEKAAGLLLRRIVEAGSPERAAGLEATAFHDAADAPPVSVAVFAEVEVDVETGEVRVVRLVSALDCGPLLDPRILETQIEGDALRAVGAALAERSPVGPDGRGCFRSLRDYPLATAIDAPDVRTLLVPEEAPPSRFGSKPLGEAPSIGPAIAIANAVAHATGLRLRDLPITPDRLRAALLRSAGPPSPGGDD
jgi:putative selenate reductase molybdopterin-binding subunit